MFVLCYGAPKTGSTLAFQLVSALLDLRGHRQSDISDTAHSPDHLQHFVPRHMARDATWLSEMKAHGTNPSLFALKTHSTCTPVLRSLIQDGAIKAIVNTRDPRDTALSLRDIGFKKSKGAFNNIAGLYDAIQSVQKHVPDTDSWCVDRALIADYDEIAFFHHRFLSRVAAYLDLMPPTRPESDQLMHVACEHTKTKNRMVRHRFFYDCSVASVELMTHALGNEIETLQGQHQRFGLNTSYPMPAPSFSTASSCVTQHTFVVLGCPRGGTSLVAGALQAIGIHMGAFTTHQFEDPDFKLDPKIAKRSRDLDSLFLPLINERNTRFVRWGWKVPNAIYYIEKIRHLLVNPIFIFVYRDEEAIARSSAKHDGKMWWLHKKRLLKVARNHSQLVQNFQQKLDPTDLSIVIQLEKVQANPQVLVDAFSRLMELNDAQIQAIEGFVQPKGGYHPLTAVTQDSFQSAQE